MDVKRGHCWRCEKKINSTTVHCKLCWIAVYCSTVCCVSDLFRHAVPECETWGPKRCCNFKCDIIGSARIFRECTGCLNAWYCGTSCQQTDWSIHRISCRKNTATIKQAVTELRENFSDHAHCPPMHQPYYIGNAIALDMLNLTENECGTQVIPPRNNSGLKKDYSILSVGCGNLRNYIHTIVSLPSEFQGKLHMTLNDHDPFVQARNVLFLFMMIAYADNDDISALVTTIWYSLHLSKNTFIFLTACLRILADITRAGLVEATRGIVDISEADLNLIRQVWQKWLELQCRRSDPLCINLEKQRVEMLEKEIRPRVALHEYQLELKEEYVETFDEWLRFGTFLPTGEARRQNLEYDNPTLTGYKHFADVRNSLQTDEFFELAHIYPRLIDFVYCVPPDLLPFGTWDHLQAQKLYPKKSLIDMYYAYINDQIQKAIVCLETTQQSVYFIVGQGTDLQSRLSQARKFDRIFTSNIADYTGTQRLLSVTKEFLNRDNKFATIVTQYWNWYMFIKEDAYDKKTVQRAISDNGKSILFPNLIQEYRNTVVHFANYLRADFTTRRSPVESHIADFRDIRETEGLCMRDFRQSLNKVVPFQYRRNVRQVNMLRGQMSRMVEWYLPEIPSS